MIFNPFWITLTKLLVMPGTSSSSPVSAPDIYIYIYISYDGQVGKCSPFISYDTSLYLYIYIYI